MSFMDRIKSFFSGGSSEHDHDHDHDHAGHDHDHDHDQASSYLQTPSAPDEPVASPTPEEIAAAARAEPPTTTVEGLSEDEPRDEVH